MNEGLSYYDELTAKCKRLETQNRELIEALVRLADTTACPLGAMKAARWAEAMKSARSIISKATE